MVWWAAPVGSHTRSKCRPGLHFSWLVGRPDRVARLMPVPRVQSWDSNSVS
jgi:hypothetical protein